jgi:uncharacterized lipoprotein YddW (UPF0748 family)
MSKKQTHDEVKEEARQASIANRNTVVVVVKRHGEFSYEQQKEVQPYDCTFEQYLNGREL